jgi:hypothetical protein
MARRLRIETAKSGATANDRRVLVSATAATPSPTASSDGFLMEGNEFVHLLFTTGGTTPVFQIQVWWYSTVSGQWHKGEVLTVNDDDLDEIEVQGLERVFLQVTGVSGTSPVLDAWIGLVVEV